ncbi:hypothetical protein EG329_002052 [Mollisiaceae sp. DMI_Dod_QoI]|nr:hypothetical protein EG329_002052 [Helotiales sp. DMI_Dod_QoI]
MATTSSTPAVETHTAPPPKTTSPQSQEELLIRKARLWEAGEIGRIGATTYLHTPLSSFLAPKRLQYPRHWERGFTQRAQRRMFSPRNLTFVVCTKSNPRLAVGYAQFVRLGDDEGARRLIESYSRLERFGLWVLGVVYGVWCWVVSWWVGGDRSEDKEAAETFFGWTQLEVKVHWEGRKDRENRWHAQSVVVRKEFQGRKAGKRLMAEVIGRAENENVVVGLESSANGEMMYRSVGFELLGRFQGGNGFEGDSGGVMLYTPKARREKGSAKA